MLRNLFFLTSITLALGTGTLCAQNTINLYPNNAETKIPKEIYGHFAEHLGRCIYDGIYVGTNSDIPNTNGYRTDIIDALIDLKIPVLRWPGGCFADTYNWKDGIGPVNERPSIVNVHWGGITEDNSFGTHEFLDFCELIGAEAFISLNVGTGTVREASEWVEYVTSTKISPMTDLRKANGREEPWNVKYWGIGNETWGCGGDMTPEYYSDIYRHYASFARGAKYKVACGASDSDYNWTEVIMKNTKNKQHLIQGLSLHYYTITKNWHHKGSATDFAEDEWFSTLSKTLIMDELLTKHSAIMDKYDPKKNVALVVDEWGTWFDPDKDNPNSVLYQQNTLRDALVAGINLNIFNAHSDRVKMTNIAQTVNVLQSVILTKDEEIVLTPTYYVFKMYNVHMDATQIPMDITSEDYEFNGETIPALNASASIKNDVLSLTVCNLDPNNEHTVETNIKDMDFSKVTGYIITADNMDDYNDFGKKEKVNIQAFKVKKPKNNALKLTIPSKSIILIQLN